MTQKKLLTRDEVVAQSLKPLYDTDRVCEQMIQNLGNALTKGRRKADYIFHNGNLESQKKAAEECMKKLVCLGYYCKVGWKETTPSGNVCYYLEISVDPPKPPLWKRTLKRVRGFFGKILNNSRNTEKE